MCGMSRTQPGRTQWRRCASTRRTSAPPEPPPAAAAAAGHDAPRPARGAGHDAAMMAAVTPVAMLFVRCPGGVSHHPDESVRAEDVEVAIEVTTRFVERLAAQKPSR